MPSKTVKRDNTETNPHRIGLEADREADKNPDVMPHIEQVEWETRDKIYGCLEE